MICVQAFFADCATFYVLAPPTAILKQIRAAVLLQNKMLNDSYLRLTTFLMVVVQQAVEKGYLL